MPVEKCDGQVWSLFAVTAVFIQNENSCKMMTETILIKLFGKNLELPSAHGIF